MQKAAQTGTLRAYMEAPAPQLPAYPPVPGTSSGTSSGTPPGAAQPSPGSAPDASMAQAVLASMQQAEDAVAQAVRAMGEQLGR